MKRTALFRLFALVVAIAVVAVVVVVAYHWGATNGSGTPAVREMPLRGMMGGWGFYGPGAGIFGVLVFIGIGLLFVWLLAALLSPAGGGHAPVGPATGDLERLRELSDMHARGQLTEEEFTAAKRKLLGLP